jgi:hypothetical protein
MCCGLVVWSKYKKQAKRFRSVGFVGLWFDPNLTEVVIKLSMCSTGMAGELFCGL